MVLLTRFGLGLLSWNWLTGPFFLHSGAEMAGYLLGGLLLLILINGGRRRNLSFRDLAKKATLGLNLSSCPVYTGCFRRNMIERGQRFVRLAAKRAELVW